MEARQLTHFSQQTLAVTYKVEQATVDYSKKFHSKGEITASFIGSPPKPHDDRLCIL